MHQAPPPSTTNSALPDVWAWSDRAIEPLSAPSASCGVVLGGLNALDDATWQWPELASLQAGAGLVVRSGWNPRGSEARPLWLAGPRGGFERFAQRTAALASEHALVPVLLPAHSDVISDGPSLMTFLRSAPAAWRFVAAPALLLTDAMLRDAEDHLARVFAPLATHERCWAVLLSDARPSADGTARVEPAPLHADSPLLPLLRKAWHALPLEHRPHLAVVSGGDRTDPTKALAQARLLGVG